MGGAVSSAASGATTGATIGSVVPGVGTAAGAVVGGVLGLAGGLFGHKKAKQAAAMAGPQPFSADFGSFKNGQYSLSPDQQMFASMAQRLGMDSAGHVTGDPMEALTSDQRWAGDNAGNALDTIQSQYGQLGQGFFDALNKVGFDPQSVANDRYQLLRQQAQPGEDQAFNALQSKLFAQGRLGTSGGGLDMKAMFDSNNQADIQRQIAGEDYGMAWQRQLSDLYNGATSNYGQAATARFGLANQLLEAGQNNNKYFAGMSDWGQGAYQNTFAPLFAAAGIGTKQGNPEGAAMVNNSNQQLINAVTGAAGQYMKAKGWG